MYLINLIISLFFIIISILLYKKFLNPVSIYLILWTICISLYSSNLILFNDISEMFWIIIISVNILYSVISIFCLLLFNNKKHKKTEYRESKLGKQLGILVLFFSMLSMLSVIPKFLFIVKTYGINLFSNIYSVYQDSIYNQIDYSSSFNFEVFNFVGAYFAVVYIQKIGLNKIVFLPLIMSILAQFSSGSRGLFLAILLMYLSSVILLNKNTIIVKSKKKLISVFLSSFIILVLITYFRTSSNQNSLSPYASELLKRLPGSKMLYQFIFYLSSPLAVLNDYIQTPNHSIIGASTFRIFYSLVPNSNFHINFIGEYLRYVPMPSNVLTYLGELIYDFGFLGMYLVVVLLSIIFTFTYLKVSRDNSLVWQSFYVVSFSLVGMSFFAWFMRPAFYWVVLIICTPISIYLEKSQKIK